MTCNNPPPKCVRCKEKYKRKIDANKFIFDNLKEKGRLQFFFHAPKCELPVRDVCNKQRKGHKTEPHIEIGAENYLSCCYQPNLVKFLHSDEKYLFLFTTCRNDNLQHREKKLNGNKFIVGYIRKNIDKGFIEKTCKYDVKYFAVKGDAFIYSFDESIPIEEKMEYSKNTRVKLVNEQDTKKILSCFKDKTNILSECIEEIKKLDAKNMKTDDKTCLVERGGNCNFQNNGCLRWSPT